MQVIGMDRQERKLERMTDIVVELHGGMNRLSVKGAFRLGLTKALEACGYGSWKEVAERTRADKEAFFAQLMNVSLPRLVRMGLPQALEAEARKRLEEQNLRMIEGGEGG